EPHCATADTRKRAGRDLVCTARRRLPSELSERAMGGRDATRPGRNPPGRESAGEPARHHKPSDQSLVRDRWTRGEWLARQSRARKSLVRGTGLERFVEVHGGADAAPAGT